MLELLQELNMCPHDSFIVLLYHSGVLIRKCKNCGEIEIKIEGWLSIEKASEIFGFELVKGLAATHPDIAKGLAEPN